MRPFLLAMAEEQHEHRSWRSAGLVGALLVLTLALNASTREQAALIREAYNDSNDNVLLAFTALVSLGQILTSAVLISAETQRGDPPDKEAIANILVSYLGSVFLHDFLLSMGSSHTFALVAFFQPLLSLVTLWVVTAVIARSVTWLSVVLLCFGCSFMSIKSATILNSDRTSLICVLSAFTLILRNIIVRQLVYLENVTVTPRKRKVILGTFLAGVLFLLTVFYLAAPMWLAPAFCAVSTCALSASTLYLTTQVLKTYNITFVSIFNTWALLLEALIITPRDHRPDIFMLLAGFLLVLLGHYFYFKDYVENKPGGNAGLIVTYSPKPVNIYEQYTRTEFLLFAALVMGVVFYVFQPQVSQRDLNTLSYVGLDKVIRKLLTVSKLEADHPSISAGPVQLP